MLCTLFDVAHTKSILKEMESKLGNKPSEQLHIKIIECFSLSKNWITLKSTENSRDNLKYIQGLRFLLMNTLIGAHVGMLMFSSPLRNTKYIEGVSQIGISIRTKIG